jgi:hypothetical protein
MRNPRKPWLRLLVMAAAVLPTSIGAQTVASTPDELRGRLTIGQRIAVTDNTGQTTTGEAESVTGSVLVLRVRDNLGTTRRTTFGFDTVRQIRGADRLWNGILVGAGVGVGVSWAIVSQGCSPNDPECTANAMAAVGVPLVAGFAAGGALVDWVIGKKVIYRSPARNQRLMVAPVLAKDKRGLWMSVRF